MECCYPYPCNQVRHGDSGVDFSHGGGRAFMLGRRGRRTVLRKTLRKPQHSMVNGNLVHGVGTVGSRARL